MMNPPVAPGKLGGPTELGPADLHLLPSFSPIAAPLSISRQQKKTKPVQETPVKSPPSSSKVQHVPCKFFRNGACTAGKNCVFSHSKEVVPSAILCKYYLKGNCKFGNKCALQHGNEKKAPGGGGNNGSSNRSNNNGNNGLKSKSQLSQFGGSERGTRQPLSSDQRSLLDFGEEVEFLSRSLSRANLEGAGFNSFGNSPINSSLNFYTPQPKTSQLSSIFSSPNQSNFSMSLPSHQQFALPDEKFNHPPTSNNSFFGGKQGGTTNGSHQERLRSNEFLSPNFSFGFSDEHDLLPSSLDELLTPTELQMRRTKVNMMSRPGFMNRSTTQETLGISPVASRFLNNYDNGYFGSSLPSGSSLGITERRAFKGNHPELEVPSNSLLSHSFTSDSLLPADNSDHLDESKDDSCSSQTSETKKGDDNHSIGNGLDDDVPFHMEGDF